MKKLYAFTACLLITVLTASAQVTFKQQNARFTNAAVHSGNCVAIADWNFDGFDDIIRLDDGNDVVVEVQRTNNTFESINLGSFNGGSGWAWGMTVADVDHNGYLDIAAGAYGPAVRILLTNSTGTAASLVSIPNSNFFVQNMTFADFNNDGWIDLFVCDDNAESHIFMNNGTGVFTESYTTINFDVTPSDDSGNYGSVWTDFDNDGDLDLYIAKCRQGVNSPTDPRRINVMFVNDGNNNFTESAAAYNINIGWQSWTASFGDIDNDSDLDLLITNHDQNSQLLENNGSGIYTDITATTGIDMTDMTPIESTIEDFDNDGFADLLISGSIHRYYHNNGNKTFTEVNGLFDNNDMLSFATGDLNHDGRIDLYTSYGNIYNNPTSINDVLWMNNTNNGYNFITFELLGTISNKAAIGGRAKIYGPWGVQLREVRAGDNYGTTNSPMLHFGLGTATQVDSAVIWFPSGYTTTLYNLDANQFVRVVENGCVSPNAGISYSLSDLFICTGTTQTITADSGYTYLWSDNSNAQSLIISAGGEYNVIITESGNSCPAISRTMVIEENPDQTPVISANGDLAFCDGGSVAINSLTWGVSSYSWNNGDTTANIVASLAGDYVLTIQGFCGTFSSDTITVETFTAASPVSQNVTLAAPGSATLTATGNSISWFDSPAAVTPIAVGDTFITPFLNTQTQYWVQNTETFGQASYQTGMPYVSGTNVYSTGATTNATMFFDVLDNCILRTIKTYTDVTGTRRIELRDNQGQLLQYKDVLISPDSQIVTLDFALTPGLGYQITTNDSANQAIPGWGNVNPRLKRNATGVSYPYTVNDVISITGSDFGNQYFYYFYDWNVETEGFDCESPLVQVTVDITTGISELSNGMISLYPNPVNEALQIKLTGSENAHLQLFDAAGRLITTQPLTNSLNTIDISSLSTGIYQAIVIQNGNSYREKLVVY